MNDRPEYPKRPRFFAMRFVRLLDEQRVQLEMRQTKHLLFLIYIAFREDRLRYKEPVQMWRKEIANWFGIDRKTVKRWIDQLKNEGWLEAWSPSNRQKTRLWVTIPTRFQHLIPQSRECEDDRDSDSKDDKTCPELAAENELKNDPQHVPNPKENDDPEKPDENEPNRDTNDVPIISESATKNVPNHVPNNVPNHVPSSIPIPVIPNPKEEIPPPPVGGSPSDPDGTDSLSSASPENGSSGTKRSSSKGMTEPDPEAFQQFWGTYPRRNGRQAGSKQEALAAWQKLSAADRAAALAALPVYSEFADGFPKDAVRYLKLRIWTEDLTVESTSDEDQDPMAKATRDLVNQLGKPKSLNEVHE